MPFLCSCEGVKDFKNTEKKIKLTDGRRFWGVRFSPNFVLIGKGLMRKAFSFLLPTRQVPESFRQGVYITNILTLLFSVLTFFLFCTLFFLFGWSATSGYIIAIAALFILIVFINRSYYNVGRLLFCLSPVYMTLLVSLYGKQAEPHHSYITYFDARYIILATTILPAIIFNLKERIKIGVCLTSTFICLMLFDLIHSVLGLGYYQRGFDVLSYSYINYITLVSYLVLVFGVLILKILTERAEQQAYRSLEKLNTVNGQLTNRNAELLQLNRAMELHNEEMFLKQTEIKASRELLTEANRLISEQQEKLLNTNVELEKMVKEKSTDLIQTNEELVRHNNELRQFSYTVSHNLRGPVARLLGLTDLFTKPISLQEKEEIGRMINKSGHELDGVLKDLSLIIDIRNDLYQVREKISFEVELTKTLSMLRDQIRPSYRIDVDFSEAPFVYSIRAMIQSILFNLLSNAIKYRNPENDLRITVKTTKHFNKDVCLRISDNGLGFNLEKQKDNIFKLYKRFHTHVDGKGLGLYLVKTQVDTLDGKIEIESEINKGTTFLITLPTPRNVSQQVFYESESAKIYYDADINNTVIVWKKNITSIEYRRAFQAVLYTLKTYNTPGWIADLRYQGVIEDAEQFWFMSTVIPEAVRCGLKRIAAVGFHDPIRKNYYNRMIEKSSEAGVTLQVFDSLEAAVSWMEGFIQRT
jgi:signal transduction histidine kinase